MRFAMKHEPRARRSVFTLLVLAGALGVASPAAAQGRTTRPFTHEPHKKVACTACHEQNGADVGEARVSEAQCHSCHHSGPVAGSCTRCHAPAKLSQGKRTMHSFRLSVSPAPVMRTLVFDHAAHENTECKTCHKTLPRLEAGALSCSGCHESHHEPDVECLSCHQSMPAGAHGNSSHLTCAGAECHRSNPVPASARSRQLCLTCHAGQRQHYPAKNCIECHVLPAAAPHARR